MNRNDVTEMIIAAKIKKGLKWEEVAKKIGLTDFHQGQVNDTETNVLLGTTYMRLVMESLDNHPVLASAAYNAGPGRARRSRGSRMAVAPGAAR